MRVLVVEPDGLTGMMVTALLNRVVDCQASWVREEGEALSLVDRQGFDAAICETRLRQGDGMAVGKQLASKGIAVVLTTTFDASQLPPCDWAVGCLEKPFNESSLMQVVSLISRTRQNQPIGDLPPHFRRFG